MITEEINLDEYRFICHKIFSGSENTMLNIINFGKIDKNDKISFITKDGKQLKTKEEIESDYRKTTEVITFNQINLKRSLYWWLKKNGGHSKNIIIDMNIDTGEIYSEDFWQVNLMIQPDENTIRVKPIFNYGII